MRLRSPPLLGALLASDAPVRPCLPQPNKVTVSSATTLPGSCKAGVEPCVPRRDFRLVNGDTECASCLCRPRPAFLSPPPSCLISPSPPFSHAAPSLFASYTIHSPLLALPRSLWCREPVPVCPRCASGPVPASTGLPCCTLPPFLSVNMFGKACLRPIIWIGEDVGPVVSVRRG